MLLRHFSALIILFFSLNSYATTKFGTMSLMGDSARLISIPAEHPHRKTQYKTTATNWNINKKINGFIKIALSELHDFEFIPLTSSQLFNIPITFESKYIFSSQLSQHSFSKLLTLGKKKSLDYLLLIIPIERNPSVMDDHLYSQVPRYPGSYGILYSNFLYNTSRNIQSYINARAFLIDIKAEKTIDDITLETYKGINIKRLYTNYQKEIIYLAATNGINNKPELKKWHDFIFNLKGTEHDKKLIIREVKSDNPDYEELDDLIADVSFVLNPPHHSLEEFSILPEKENLKVQKHFHQHLYTLIASVLKDFVTSALKSP